MFDAMFVLRLSHAEQLMNRVSPSSHWLVSRLNVRVLDAMVRLTTVDPFAVVRSSGSRVRFPMTVIMVSPAMSLLPSGVVAVVLRRGVVQV